jgi:hypothetical protein
MAKLMLELISFHEYVVMLMFETFTLKTFMFVLMFVLDVFMFMVLMVLMHFILRLGRRILLLVVVSPLLLDLLRRSVLIWVVLVVSTIMVIIESLWLLLCLVLGSLAVVLVHTLGLGEFVDLSTGETSKKLLGELVTDRLAWESCELV